MTAGNKFYLLRSEDEGLRIRVANPWLRPYAPEHRG
jgi:hypothetical protein